MRKALAIGIDDYPNAPLSGCVNDAEAVADMLARNGDGSKNFDVMTERNVPTKGKVKSLIKDCFAGDAEIALLYFSGHGRVDMEGGFLVTPDYSPDDWGVSLADILSIAGRSNCRNKIVVLDCCHSGSMGEITTMGENTAVISEGLTVLSSSRRDEPSIERGGHGVFTSLLVEALSGAAADVTGHITPGGIYAYIDKALGAWDQRPVFKTNVNSFISLRTVVPQVPVETLRRIAEHFGSEDEVLALDPSFEPTNSPEIEHAVVEPYADAHNMAVFSDLQKLESIGLVVPVESEHMYFAAMRSKGCRLTEIGKQYWRLIKADKI